MKEKILSLGNVSPKIAAQLEDLPCFKGVKTERLCQIAQGVVRDKLVMIKCRVTAMVVIVNNRSLDDEVFQIPPEPSSINFA